MSRLKTLTKKDYQFALIPFGIALLVYGLTTCPTVFSEDCGEFIFGSYTLGVLHPPGYPIYALLGKLFSYLPFKTIAWRINFFSGFCSAAAVYFLYLCGRKFDLHPLAIGSACLGMAFGKIFWSQSVIAEVYALNTFFFCITMFMMLQWIQTKENRYIYFFSLLFGLSLCDHQIMGMFIPYYMVVILVNDSKFYPLTAVVGALGSYLLGNILSNMFWSEPFLTNVIIVSSAVFCLFMVVTPLLFKMDYPKWFRILFSKKRFWFSLLFFGLGLSIYLYLPIRAAAKPFLNWGNPYNWENFWFHVRRSVYNPDIKVSLSDYLERLKVMWVYFDLLVQDCSVVYFFLGLFGIYWFMKKNFRWACFTLILFLIGGVGLVFIHKSSLSANTRFVIRVFYFQSYAPYALFAAFGMEFILHKIRKVFHLRELSNRIKWSYYSAVALLPILPLALNWSYTDLSENYFCYDYAKAIMDTMEPNAVMYAAGDMVIFNLIYLQLVEKYRLDVTVYDNFSVFHNNFMGFDFYKGILPDPEEERIRQRTYAKMIEKEYGRRPIYFYTPQNLRYKPDFGSIPVGLIYKVHKKSDPIPPIRNWWDIYNIRGVNNLEYFNDMRVNPFICDFHLRKARFYLNTKRPQKAAEEYEMVVKTRSLVGMTEVALYWLNNRNPAYALNLLREALEIDNTLVVNHYNIGLALTALSEPQQAVVSFQAFLNKWQGGAGYYEDAFRRMRTLQNQTVNAQDLNNIGIRYMWKGEYKKSIRCFEEGLRLKQTNALILLNMAICYENMKDIAKSGYYYQTFLSNWKGKKEYRNLAEKGLNRLRSKAGAPAT